MPGLQAHRARRRRIAAMRSRLANLVHPSRCGGCPASRARRISASRTCCYRASRCARIHACAQGEVSARRRRRDATRRDHQNLCRRQNTPPFIRSVNSQTCRAHAGAPRLASTSSTKGRRAEVSGDAGGQSTPALQHHRVALRPRSGARSGSGYSLTRSPGHSKQAGPVRSTVTTSLARGDDGPEFDRVVFASVTRNRW